MPISDSVTLDSPDNLLTENSGSSNFLVVGIGASAGGIQALKEFFRHVPENSGMAYVVILHLSPDHDSQLAAVLQEVTKMKVIQVVKREKTEPDHVYVIPPNQHLMMEGDCITVTTNLYLEERRAPVDIFFRTLAESHMARAVCVVLSGTGANGSMGLKRVKERGGVVLVQNPKEAEFNEMPRNAIATDLVDAVLPVAAIPAKIVDYKNNLGTIHISVETVKRPEDQQQALREIFAQLRLRTGNDFSNYKRPTLLRRIERRINIRNLPDLPSYAAFIQEHPDEATALLKDLLISVTNFFRDRKAWDVIETEIIPRLLQNKTVENQLRIWVAGCATGEEAYSIAMFCAEKTAGMPDAPKVQIFATDIDETAIAYARDGLYSLNDAADVSTERLRRFFSKEGDHYRIRREIREMVMFAHHNFIKDPPFSHLDLITCRNVLIYLNEVAQERVAETFHFALETGGYLFLGSSESVDVATDLYAVFNREHHIYQTRQAKSLTFPILEPVSGFRPNQQKTATFPETDKRGQERIAYGDLHQRLLEEYAPPSVVVNEDYDIIHISEKAGRYLQITGGEPSKNLLKLVRHELRLELRSALFQASEQQREIKVRATQINTDDLFESITINVKPVFKQDTAGHGFILVLFEPATAEEGRQEVLFTSSEPATQHLEEELMRMKTQLRGTIEQYEFQGEELKASNEELQAMNEELRSAAEELETSKEELQSINEELRTVNQELKVKIDETSMAGNNLQNLINSTDIGTIFLDRSLRVKMFTPAIVRIFNLIPADYGRLLSDITTKFFNEQIGIDAELVLESLQTVEREITTFDKQVFMMRALPYRTSEDRISGVVLTFINITERKKAESALKESESRFRTLNDSVPQLIWANDAAGIATYFNQRWYEYSGLTYEQSVGLGWEAIIHPNDALAAKEKWHAVLAEGKIFDTEYRLRRGDGVYRWHIGRNVPLHDSQGKTLGWFGSATDIEDLKTAENLLRESEQRLQVTMTSASDFAIVTFDKQGLIQGWSTGAESIFGFGEEEAIGQPSAIVFTPEDRAANVPQQEMNRAREEGRAADERWHIRKNGERFFVSGVMRPIILNERLSGYVKIARDMTEHQAATETNRISEERYRIALQSAEMGAWDLNIKTDTVIWNSQHYTILGLKPDDRELNGSYLLQFVHPGDAKRVKHSLDKAVKETGVYHEEFRIIRADNGETRWVSDFGRVVAKNNNDASRIVGVIYDITERKMLEQQREEFIGIASHELRTPITSIKAYAQVLQEMFEQTTNTQSARLMQKLNGQVDRLTGLIRDLLDTTKISEGQLSLNLERFNLNDLITGRTEELQRISGSHHLVWKAGSPHYVTADKERIGQVLINLISNAIKYSPKGGDVIISCRSEDNGLKVSVRDNGIGIPEEMQRKVFDRFFRIRQQQIETFPGMGLGLYITAGIVHRHGGTIGVDSKEGEGSTFFFTLPVDTLN